MLRYVGGGSFLPGVPARDLTADEVAQYGGEKRLVASRLYVQDKSNGKTQPDQVQKTRRKRLTP